MMMEGAEPIQVVLQTKEKQSIIIVESNGENREINESLLFKEKVAAPVAEKKVMTVKRAIPNEEVKQEVSEPEIGSQV